MSLTAEPTGQLVVRTVDRIDYWIRRHVHATDFSPAELWSAPEAARRWHCLKAQYDALAPPIPPRIAALVEQLERQK